MNWLDLAIACVVVVLLIISIKRGFMTSVLTNFSFGINAILSFFLCKPIQHIYNNWFHLGSSIANSYSSSLISKSENFATNLLSFENSDTLHTFVKSTIKEGNFNGFEKTMFNWFLNKKSLYSELHESGISTRSLSDIISETFASFYTTIISFVTSLVLIYLIYLLIKLLVNKLRKIGFVRVIDSSLGVFYGLFRCLIIFIVICSIIKLISPFSFMKPVIAYIDGSFFGKLIYSQISNFIDNYLSFGDIIRSIFKT